MGRSFLERKVTKNLHLLVLLALLQLIPIAAWTVDPRPAASSPRTGETEKLPTLVGPDGNRRINYQERNFESDFSNAIVKLIDKTWARALQGEKEAQLSDRVWRARDTLPGFRTDVVLNPHGDLVVGADFLNIYETDDPDEAFERFVVFVSTALIRNNEKLPGIGPGQVADDKYGHWFGWETIKKDEGEVIYQGWEHSRLHVTVSMVREPELRSGDRNTTVYKYSIFIQAHDKEVGR